MYNPSLLFDNRSCLAEGKKNLGLLKKDKKSSPFLSSLPGCCWSVSHEIEVSIFSKREGREGGLFVVTNPSSYQSPICRRNLEDMKIFAPETFLQKSKSTLNIPYLIYRSSVKKVTAKLRDLLSSRNAKIQTGRNISFCVTEMLRGRLFPCLAAFFNTHHTRSRHSKTGFTAGPWKIPSLAMFWFSHSWAHRGKIQLWKTETLC